MRESIASGLAAVTGALSKRLRREEVQVQGAKKMKQGWGTQRSRYAEHNNANLAIHPVTIHGLNFDALARVVDGADKWLALAIARYRFDRLWRSSSLIHPTRYVSFESRSS